MASSVNLHGIVPGETFSALLANPITMLLWPPTPPRRLGFSSVQFFGLQNMSFLLILSRRLLLHSQE